MMFALSGGVVEINVQAIVMAERLPAVSKWRLSMLDDKTVDVSFAEFDLIRPMLAAAGSISLGPMHGSLQILPGA